MLANVVNSFQEVLNLRNVLNGIYNGLAGMLIVEDNIAIFINSEALKD